MVIAVCLEPAEAFGDGGPLHPKPRGGLGIGPCGAALAVEFCRQDQAIEAFAVIIMLECHTRPGGFLSLTKDCMLSPRAGKEHWPVLVYPQHRPGRSQAGAADDTAIVGSPRSPWLKRLVAAAAANSAEKVFPMEYTELAKHTAVGAEAIGVSPVACQARRAGASIDAANGVRRLPDIHKKRTVGLKSERCEVRESWPTAGHAETVQQPAARPCRVGRREPPQRHAGIGFFQPR